MDVAYALNEIYSGIYSSKSLVRSLSLKNLTGEAIPYDLKNTLYLVYTQAEKDNLKSKGYGSGDGSRTLTIHEAQGLTYGTVVIVRTTEGKTQLHDSVPHAVVAISRHTNRCVYYSTSTEDVIAYLIKRAQAATTSEIRDYNIQMAIHHRDSKVLSTLIEPRKQEAIPLP